MIAAGLAVLALGACSPQEASPAPASGAGDALIVSPASYDLAAGEETRFLVGLQTPDRLFVSHGTVDLGFTYLGTRQEEAEPEPGPTASASFLQIEGAKGGDEPVAGPPSQGRGVYSADVTFDRAGFWEVEVTAELEGSPVKASAAFEVYEEHVFPAPGDPAPVVRNHVLGSKEVGAESLDSRAREGEPVPDEVLHRDTVAAAVRDGEPVLVVVSTPLYCISQFCGPVTDVIEGLARRYDDRARFVHLEVWRDFEGRVVNKAAAAWAYRDGDLLEPWVFLVGAGGKIERRWDNVATAAEIEPLLERLPRL